MNNSTKKNKIHKITCSLAFIFFIFIGFQLNAQITIQENIFINLIGKKYREVLYETSLNIDDQLAEIKAAVGTDQIWDFSDLSYIDSTIIIYEVMNVNPNDPFLINPELAGSQYINKVTILPGSGGVEDSLMTYQYTSLEDGKWTVNGAVTLIDLDLDGSLDSALQFFVPPNLQVPFPVTSTSMWHDSTNLVTIFDGMEFVSSTMIDSSWVRGYGTLITPYGTAEALRVHNKNITKNPFLPIDEVSNDYDFVTEDDMFSASIVVEDGRAFYSVRKILDGPTSTIDLEDIKFTVDKVSPNPFREKLEISVNLRKGGEIEFQLISVDGNKMSLLKKEYLPGGTQNIELSIENIPNGLYFLQVKSGRFLQHIPVNKI